MRDKNIYKLIINIYFVFRAGVEEKKTILDTALRRRGGDSFGEPHPTRLRGHPFHPEGLLVGSTQLLQLYRGPRGGQ